MKLENLHTLSDEDIITRRAEYMRELVGLRMQLRLQQLEDNSRIRKTRKALARLNTELRAREIAKKLPKGALLGRASVRLDAGVPEEQDKAKGKRSRFGLGVLKEALLGKPTE